MTMKIHRMASEHFIDNTSKTLSGIEADLRAKELIKATCAANATIKQLEKEIEQYKAELRELSKRGCIGKSVTFEFWPAYSNPKEYSAKWMKGRQIITYPKKVIDAQEASKMDGTAIITKGKGFWSITSKDLK